MGLINEKNRVQKSRDTAPLTSACVMSLPDNCMEMGPRMKTA